MPTLRPYQQQLEDEIDAAWAGGSRVVLATAPTGAGKSVLFTNILAREKGACAAIAHRRELVTQMSLHLARCGVRHRIVGPQSVAREAAAIHLMELKRSYVDANARCGVIGIDSLPGLTDRDPWLAQVRTWVGDEGHHFLRDNKWGKGIAMFPAEARGLLVTATGFRADGNGLGRGIQISADKWSNDGLADAIVLGPSMRELIDMGYLTDYRVVAPPSDVDYSTVPVTATGDLSPVKLRAAVHKSTQIVGDVVKHYLKFAAGKLGVTFAVDIEEATRLAQGFRDAGVSAEVVTGKTPALLRQRIFGQFRRRELLQIVSVDILGEGVDIPGIEVVSMVRKTESKGLFDQQFGRSLRLLIDEQYACRWDTYTDEERRAIIASSAKPKALIIDHVGNVERHRPPDAYRFHTLDRRERRSKPKPGDEIPLRTCLNAECLAVYERSEPCCPFCSHKPVPSNRSAPEFVDGDLTELDEAALKALRGEVERIDGPARVPGNLEGAAAQAVKNRHLERQHAQKQLRDAITLWAGWQRDQGREDKEIYRRFWFNFGTDMMTAQTLGRNDAESLYSVVQSVLLQEGIVAATRPFDRLELDDYDITGERHGKLVAVKKIEGKDSKVCKWLWACDCGGSVLRVRESVRRSGESADCGCRQDITGERHGKLVAVEKTEEKLGTAYKWLWKCDCGKEVTRVRKGVVTSGDSASCGCAADRTGVRYGRLEALRETGEVRNENKVWVWKCDCGVELEREFSSVRKAGDRASCGCLPKADYAGVRYGKLVGKAQSEVKAGTTWKWVWACDCGNEVVLEPRNPKRRGDKASCGKCK